MNANVITTKRLKQRVNEVDIIKAVAIIFMVFGHAGAPFSHFVYLFHMAVFFIASGFFYKEKNADSIQNVLEFIKKKLKELWLPFFIWGSLFTCLNNFLIRINVYTDNAGITKYVQGPYIDTTECLSLDQIIKNVLKCALFSCDSQQMCGVFWFLRVLFMISVLYCVNDYLISRRFSKHLMLQGVISAGLLAIGYCCSVKAVNFHQIEIVCSCYWMFYAGHLLGMEKCKEFYSKLRMTVWIEIFLIAFIFLIFLNKIGSVGLATDEYGNPLFLIVSSLTGWLWLWSFAAIVCNTKNFLLESLKEGLLYVGQRTLIIFVLHLLSFKIVNAIVCQVYGLPYFCIAAYPNLYGDHGLWWLAFTLCGVSVPLLADWLFQRIKVVELIYN